MNKILLVTNRNLNLKAGDWNLIDKRAKAFYDTYSAVTFVYGLMRRSESVNLEEKEYIKYEIVFFNNAFHWLYCYFHFFRRVRTALANHMWQAVILSGFYSYFLVPLLWKKSFLIDIHGTFEERLDYLPKQTISRYIAYIKYYFFTFIEYWICRSACGILCVSPTSQEAVKRKHPDKNIILIPCGLSASDMSASNHELRAKWRKRFNLTDEVAFVYSGGTSSWQLIDKVCLLYKKIKQVPKYSKSKLLFFTHEPKRVNEIAALAGLSQEDIVAVKLDPEDVIPALHAGDVGVLLRESNSTNYFAFPNKLGEYLSAGLVVVSSPGLEIAKRLIADACGVLVDPKYIVNNLDVGELEHTIRDLNRILQTRQEEPKQYYELCREIVKTNFMIREYLRRDAFLIKTFST